MPTEGIELPWAVGATGDEGTHSDAVLLGHRQRQLQPDRAASVVKTYNTNKCYRGTVSLDGHKAAAFDIKITR